MKFLLAILFISQLASATENKSQERWDELMRLVGVEMKIVESAKRKGPDLKYRMLELHSEKLKLLHEKNNKEFMAQSIKKGSGKGKEAFFAETRAYYRLTKNYGLALLKEYPNTMHKPWIYYALGLNSRDYGTDKMAERYLLDSIYLAGNNQKSLRHHATTALADHYYNEKKYPEAIKYYEKAIKNPEDEWLTKHLFNLSWCYLKSRQFDAAITTIRESYTKSKNLAYVDIRDQVLDNVGSFYVYASRPLEGLEFYLDNEKDPVPYLLPMALKAMDKGHEKETEEILASVQKLINKNDTPQYQEDLLHNYLDFYRHYSRFYDHEVFSRKIVAYYKEAESEKGKEKKLPVGRKDDAIEKMRSLAGFLQVKLAKDMKRSESEYREKELNLVLNFFQHLIALDDTRKAEYYYYQAETYYSLRRFKDAAPSYKVSIQEARKAKDLDRARKALNSLLALTGMEVLDKDSNRDYLIFGYTEHLSFWPRDPKSEQIYPKLFEIYLELQDDEKASDLVATFHKHYPEHLKEQQKLMTKVLDQFIEKKNTKKLAFYIHKFKEGFLKFSKKTITKTEIVLGNILFIQYQEVAKSGDKLAAAKGFEEIYVNKLYTDKVKFQSAFFAALAYLELGEPVKSYHWIDLAHARMTKAEMLERREEELKITERMYRLQDFVTAGKMSRNHLARNCSLKDRLQNRFFEIGIMTSLVEDSAKDAEEIVTQYSKCLENPALVDTALAQIYQQYEKKGEFFALRSFVKKHPVEPYLTQYRLTLQKWYWSEDNLSMKDKMLSDLEGLKNDEATKWVEEIRSFAKAQKAQKSLMAFNYWNKPAFDGDAYNKALENYLKRVQNYKDKYHGLTQSSQTDLAIYMTKVFSELYLAVGKRIQTMDPKGLDKEIVNDFRGAMRQVASQFLNTSNQYEKSLAKALREKEALTQGSRSIASLEEVENPVNSFFTGLTMDKVRE